MESKGAALRQIPIPSASPAQCAPIEALVRNLLDTEGQGPQVAKACAELVEAWERELNALVYELYGLTEEEIAIVEGAESLKH